MTSVWPKFRAFDPEMVLHFHFTFKPFPGHAQKRKRVRERERGRKKEERVEIVQSWARRYRPPTSPAPCWSRSREVSGFDDFFLGFVCVLRNEWYYIFVWQPRKCEKMWETSRKCVFYGIFKNTTKHQKIFFETFFEMQLNTRKYFPFRKIAFSENRIFSRNTFTRTKRSLSLWKSWSSQ